MLWQDFLREQAKNHSLSRRDRYFIEAISRERPLY